VTNINHSSTSVKDHLDKLLKLNAEELNKKLLLSTLEVSKSPSISASKSSAKSKS
jgi:hypothetical protein